MLLKLFCEYLLDLRLCGVGFWGLRWQSYFGALSPGVELSGKGGFVFGLQCTYH